MIPKKKPITNIFTKLKNIFIIAEIGVNHNGDLNLAMKMIDEAKKLGADAVKFQTYKAEILVSQNTPKVKYQIDNKNPSESHFEMLKKLELSNESHLKLKKYCEKTGIIFLSTPYDIESAKFLFELDVKFFKTSSADLIDLPLHSWISKTKKPTIISVGMSNLEEIKQTLDLYQTNKNLILLHCVSNYPCSDISLNMQVMKTLNKHFNLPVGFSDHSIGNIASIMSVVLGAKVIEKHFTLDKELIGPDHLASSNPDEFKSLVSEIRRAESMLGSEIKSCQPEEKEMARVSKKSIHVRKMIKAGEIVNYENLELKRPGTGLMPREIDKIIGRVAKYDLNTGHLIKLSDLK